MELDYLNEDFDPKVAKVAQLRRILVENDVELSHGLKKSELCELFEKSIRPKREELLRHSDSKDHKDDIERATTDSSYSRDISSEDSAFSNVNDFQKKAKKSKKAPRKRKAEEFGDADEQGNILEAPKTKKRGKKRQTTVVTEGESANRQITGSPLVDKVHSKSPVKTSPHKSLVIEKFESSSSSSPSSSPGPSSPNADILDFSLKRRTASPDFSKLKISPEFREQLAKASSGSSYDTPLKTRPASVKKEPVEASFEDLPSFSSAKSHTSDKKSSRSATPNKVLLENENSSPAVEQSPHQEDANESETATAEGDSNGVETQKKSEIGSVEEDGAFVEDETIESSQAEDNDESISLETLAQETSEARIQTPQLATKEDVEELEQEAEKLADQVADEEANEHAKETSTHQKTHKRRSVVAGVKCGARKLGSLLWKLTLNLVIMTPILFGLWYREQRIQVGYCGHEVNLPTFENPHGGQWISKVEEFLEQQKPACLPCPVNAICYPYMKIKCKPDYAVTKSKWSLQGLFPVSDYCAKDSRREKLIAEVIDKSLKLLRTKNGNVKCGDSPDDLESGITEEDLYRIFYESRAPSINSEEFEDLWSQVVEDLKHEPDITWRQRQTLETDSSGDTDVVVETDDLPEQEEHLQHGRQNGIFRSTSKRYIGLRCKFEREVYQTYQRFKYVIWAVVGMIIAVKTVKHKLRAYFRRQEKIEELTHQVVAKLQKSASDSQESSSPAYLSVVQLRDVLLNDVVDLKLKNELWNSVVKKLESNNTNVNGRLMEVHGEIMKCWEWVGPLGD
ncbi:LAME_0H11320g1_1 [Lachancea meyersii CBS 8951]|uniref:LAME_0H11320g1_1 n=1 Tax=Lachancea meyersii CBS 8951 TaxID=1266667 RepID=A0A1G4KG72_9SACH|nr:LAME_0H11320g1_1 [Lachancea meyersii CBS 8951]